VADEACPLCGAGLDPRQGFAFGAQDYARCAGCGAAVATPFPGAAGIGAFYREEYHGACGHAEGSARRRAMLRRLLARIPRRTPGRLLDAGCGAGHLLALARDAGWEAVGVEPSAEARDRYGLEVLAGLLEDVPLPDACFDVVRLVNVLDQAPRPARLLATAHRVLRPGGLLLVRVPNGDFHRAAWAAIRRLGPGGTRRLRGLVIFHLLSLNAAAPRTLLARARFAAIRVTNAPLSGSEWSLPGGAVARAALVGGAALARVGAGVVAGLTAGRALWAPSLLALAERAEA
jgi:SAM-dependent methyltransferase